MVTQHWLRFGVKSEANNDSPKNLINNWITADESYVEMMVLHGRWLEQGRWLFDDVLGHIQVRGHIEGGTGLFSEHGLTD